MDAPLEVRVMQSGFGGLSGTLYRVEPDGAFVARHIVASEEGEVIKAGRMGLGSMIALAEAVRAAELAELPEELAVYTGVNPTLVEVRYGKSAHTLALPPGRQLSAGCEGVVEGAACRMLEFSNDVADAIESQQ